jgi:hypothetical protein
MRRPLTDLHLHLQAFLPAQPVRSTCASWTTTDVVAETDFETALPMTTRGT